jgi:hypothetical protein
MPFEKGDLHSDEGERGLGKRREEKVRWVLVDATAAIA